jgi:hypothetical protein
VELQLAAEARRRLAGLANFLRSSANLEVRPYKLVGILLSHMHFDHSDDIPLLLELLAADVQDARPRAMNATFDPLSGCIRYGQNVSTIRVGEYTDHRGRVFHLVEPRVEAEDLPKIYCDYDSIIYLLTYGFYADYRALDIDGNDLINPPGTRRRRQRRYWFGNTALKEELDRRRRLAVTMQDPRHFTRQTTPAWDRVKNAYALRAASSGNASRYQQPPSTPNDYDEPDNVRWYEITLGGGRLHYDDSYNLTLPESQRCVAGQQCTAFDAGSYRVIPYVWDHSNTGCCLFGAKAQRAQDEQTAGSLQRCSAFMIARKNIRGAKRTLCLGSGGEMSHGWTRHFDEPDIETDLLVQAVLPRILRGVLANIVGSFRWQLRHYLEFMVRHITVKEAVLFVHFEDFIGGVPSTTEYEEEFDNAVPHNLRILRREVRRARRRLRRDDESGQRDIDEPEDEEPQTEEAGTEQDESLERVECYERFFRRNRFYAMKRMGFESPFPFGAGQFWHGLYTGV